MKNTLKIVALSGLAFVLTSCGTANDIYGNNPNSYPTNGTSNGSVYRANDGQVYRRGEVYRDRNGNVYQNGRVIRTGDVYGNPGILGRNSNQTVYYPNQNKRNLPPGQAKKIYGGNAKDYAKGQQNKRNNQWKKYSDDRKDHQSRNHKDYKKPGNQYKKYDKKYKKGKGN